MSAYVLYLEVIQVKLEEEQKHIRALLRQRQIKILELVTKNGILCRYASKGYEHRIDMLPSVILMGL
ncbi:hypothetical protein [Paenibacillus prosopidis]|uniref:Uncharacterized protein n=1 Tax=Paenibacillus prosopidis TaxID=630520 RepID=A0A368VH65_9BACL|nr:hypothetical protein [Paenibacillus prosopidis]RCW40533.1 hypothetical protein DFP97_1349 [Paenibacillus prosopidis]